MAERGRTIIVHRSTPLSTDFITIISSIWLAQSGETHSRLLAMIYRVFIFSTFNL